jgi:hypothetical protein
MCSWPCGLRALECCSLIHKRHEYRHKPFAWFVVRRLVTEIRVVQQGIVTALAHFRKSSVTGSSRGFLNLVNLFSVRRRYSLIHHLDVHPKTVATA